MKQENLNDIKIKYQCDKANCLMNRLDFILLQLMKQEPELAKLCKEQGELRSHVIKINQDVHT